MNIIIESLNNIRTTGKGTDIDSIKLFVANSYITSVSQILAQGKSDSKTYVLTIMPDAGLDKTNYKGYRLIPVTAIPTDQTYRLFVEEVDLGKDFTFTDAAGHLSDEHTPAYVIGRQISAINTEILAQDANSQQLTFYMRKKYDGVSFITPDKRILFDYIPVDPKDLEDAAVEGLVPNFLSDEAIVITEGVIPPDQQQGEWIMLKWNLPYQATKTAGIVKFAISVVAKSGDERTYTWQTEPSSFSVLENLAPRLGIVLTSENKDPLTQLTNRVENIETFLGNNTDDDPINDQELVIGGGNANEYIEEEDI